MQSEQLTSIEDNTRFSVKLSKKILLACFEQIENGYLIYKEQGAFQQCFGDKNHELVAEIDIIDSEVFPKLVFGGSVGAGETFVQGLWQTSNLTKVIQLFACNLHMLDAWESKLGWLLMPFNKFMQWSNKNSITQSKQNISAHYDLGNDLYRHFLDDSMMYSSAIYANTDTTLSEAQQAKLKLICDKLQLQPSDHLLEIGTGWGSLAIFAAKYSGCRVTTTTISEEQHQYAQERIVKEGLQNQITLLKQDYRKLTGRYDKLVSIEMIEAVGKEYLSVFFKQCQSLLKPDGLMLLQSITINDQRYQHYAKGVDFIQKHIFPGGFLPSIDALNQHIKDHTRMVIRDLHDIGLDYAQTLKDWQDNFNDNKASLQRLGYDETFQRLWQFYFSYCEGGFLARTISTVQLVITQPKFVAGIVR
jgi:cyclopropane-fatty-acyl-phospholipid synthase